MDINDILHEFKTELNKHYKAYRFSHNALYSLENIYQDFKTKHPQIKNYVIEDNDFDITIRFKEEDIAETKEHGLYQRILAGSTLATFYNLWEDNYRNRLAKKKGIPKNEVKSEIFFELNKIRQAVIHNNFNKTSKLEGLNLLSFILIKEEFRISSYEVEKIYQLITKELDLLKEFQP